MTLTIAAPSICCSVGGKWSNAFGITNSNCHTQIALWNGVMETHNPTLAKWVFNVRIYMGILIHNFETKLSQTALGTDIVGFNLYDRGICCCFMLPSVGCLDRIVACINTTQAQNTIQRGIWFRDQSKRLYVCTSPERVVCFLFWIRPNRICLFTNK